tara:strand:- start:113 stop:586 length:474 start_codon:yes stop_codon:yes gene_type:complete
MPKPISQLIPDFREALQEGLKDAVGDVVEDLIEEGPYWSGLFAESWRVVAGAKSSIPMYIPRSYPVPRTSREDKKPPARSLVPFIPENSNLEGYTIGNMTEYRGYAMDLLPTNKGRQMGNAPNATAKKDWFLLYVHAPKGGMGKRINDTLTNVFRRY